MHTHKLFWTPPEEAGPLSTVTLLTSLFVPGPSGAREEEPSFYQELALFWKLRVRRVHQDTAVFRLCVPSQGHALGSEPHRTTGLSPHPGPLVKSPRHSNRRMKSQLWTPATCLCFWFFARINDYVSLSKNISQLRPFKVCNIDLHNKGTL